MGANLPKYPSHDSMLEQARAISTNIFRSVSALFFVNIFKQCSYLPLSLNHVYDCNFPSPNISTTAHPPSKSDTLVWGDMQVILAGKG
jgi:hypothetical protein